MATVGVLWSAAVVVVVVVAVTLSSGEEASVPTESSTVEAICGPRPASGPGTDEYFEYQMCIVNGVPEPQEATTYDSASAAFQIGLISLAAAALIAGVVIWTRPQGTPASGEAPATPSAESAGLTGSLRQLKVLQEDGILTDEEYETKRRALTERL